MPPATQAVFLELRSRLSRVTLLKYFDLRNETELWTDASGTAVGGGSAAAQFSWQPQTSGILQSSPIPQ
jgi:hypothetical protein